MEETTDLFGEGVKKAEEAAKQGEEGEEGEEKEGEEEEEEASARAAAAAAEGAEEEGAEGAEGEQDGDAEKVAIAEAVQDDLEVAWENLEAARVIYTKHEAEVRACVRKCVCDCQFACVPGLACVLTSTDHITLPLYQQPRWGRSASARSISA